MLSVELVYCYARFDFRQDGFCTCSTLAKDLRLAQCSHCYGALCSPLLLLQLDCVSSTLVSANVSLRRSVGHLMPATGSTASTVCCSPCLCHCLTQLKSEYKSNTSKTLPQFSTACSTSSLHMSMHLYQLSPALKDSALPPLYQKTHQQDFCSIKDFRLETTETLLPPQSRYTRRYSTPLACSTSV